MKFHDLIWLIPLFPLIGAAVNEAIELFGRNDQNLKLIERSFGVRLVPEVRLLGEFEGDAFPHP